MKSQLLFVAICLTTASMAQLYTPGAGVNTTAGGMGNKIGIGTSAPGIDLDVVGFGQILRNPCITCYTTLRLYNETNTPAHSLEIDYSGSNYPGSLLINGIVGEAASITTVGAYPMMFGTVNTARMIIAANGNIGIGTITPTHKLEVNGIIRSKEVKVEASPWPDYVFNDDYKLTDLKSLDEYIRANKHLPEVPGAKEMETNGVELGNMNMLLLKKIEELTLYIIELDKKDEARAREIKELKVELSKLRP